MPRSKPTPVRFVMLVGLAYYGFDAGIRRGINSFRQTGRRWRLMDGGHNRNACMDPIIESRLPHGFIGNVTDEDIETRLADLRRPTVNLSGARVSIRFPNVVGDDFLVGKMAADYLLERGHTNFAFYSELDRFFERERWRGFQDRLGEAGFSAKWILFDVEPLRRPAAGKALVQRIGDGWLRSLPKPLAVFCAVDRLARWVTDQAAVLDLAVPEQVAVLGVDNFEGMCMSASPPISSINNAGEQIGWRAAEILDRMMNGEQVPMVTTIAPQGVVERRSTQAIAVADPVVAKALSYLAENAASHVSIHEMVRQLSIPCRSFQRRFRQVVGRTPLEELFRNRLELARQRLLNTDDSVYTTAIESGFRDAEAFSGTFKRHFGVTPSQYRRKNHSPQA